MWDMTDEGQKRGKPRVRGGLIAETVFSSRPTYIVEPTPDGKWQAYETDYDMFDPIGYGATQDEAVADLLEQLEE